VIAVDCVGSFPVFKMKLGSPQAIAFLKRAAVCQNALRWPVRGPVSAIWTTDAAFRKTLR
jgi:hypothetical protein